MTIQEFNNNYYIPTWRRINGLKINQITDKDRMILAMGSSAIAIDNNQYEIYIHTLKEIASLDISQRANFVPVSKKQILQEIAENWNVPIDKLSINLKKLFSK